jgi:hypothetical protein
MPFLFVGALSDVNLSIVCINVPSFLYRKSFHSHLWQASYPFFWATRLATAEKSSRYFVCNIFSSQQKEAGKRNSSLQFKLSDELEDSTGKNHVMLQNLLIQSLALHISDT